MIFQSETVSTQQTKYIIKFITSTLNKHIHVESVTLKLKCYTDFISIVRGKGRLKYKKKLLFGVPLSQN